MSDSKPGGGSSGILLPVPFLLGSPSSSPDIDKSNQYNQPFSFGDGGNQIMESSFEEFNLNASSSSQSQRQQPFALQQQEQVQQQQQQLQPKPQPSVETVVTGTGPPIKGIIKATRLTQTRNYKLHPGKTIFFCGGRFLTSRAFWAFCLSLFLIFMPSILFFIFMLSFSQQI